MPELEFWQTANERTELVVLLGGETWRCVAVFEAFILRQGRIPFWLEKEEEEV